jgi:transcription elongation GreA/GreB family factor
MNKIRFSSTYGRRLLLNQLDEIRRNEQELSLRRGRAISRLGLDRQVGMRNHNVLDRYDNESAGLIRHRNELEQTICACTAVAPPPKILNPMVGQIGTVVITRNEQGVHFANLIGGYGENFEMHDPPIVAYDSYVGSSLMRKAEGDVARVPVMNDEEDRKVVAVMTHDEYVRDCMQDPKDTGDSRAAA